MTTPAEARAALDRGVPMTAGEIAVLLGVNPKTVTRWARAGKVPCIRTPGGHRRYDPAVVRRLLAGELPGGEP